jgi:hypothetical protein
MKNGDYSFRVNIETDDETGEVLAVYFQIRAGKSAEVREFSDGKAFADYDRSGCLLGIEVLAPCRLSVLDKIEGNDATAQRFVKRSAPRQLVMT